MANSIHNFAVLLCWSMSVFMIWLSRHNVVNKKNINTFGVLTFLQMRTVLTDKKLFG